MSIYNTNYQRQVIESLPVNKRLTIWANWLFVLIYPIDWLKQLTYIVFKQGISPSRWTAGTYAKDDVVEYVYKSYISLKDSNTDLPTSSSWEKISDNWRGVDERVLYTANKGTFEYALNLYFRGVWCGLSPSGSGDIWIETVPVASGFFRVGNLGEQSSNVGREKSSEAIPYEPDIPFSQASFTIWFQEDLYNALATTNDAREAIVRGFADKYNIAGLYYSIQTYSGHLC